MSWSVNLLALKSVMMIPEIWTHQDSIRCVCCGWVVGGGQRGWWGRLAASLLSVYSRAPVGCSYKNYHHQMWTEWIMQCDFVFLFDKPWNEAYIFNSQFGPNKFLTFLTFPVFTGMRYGTYNLKYFKKKLKDKQLFLKCLCFCFGCTATWSLLQPFLMLNRSE